MRFIGRFLWWISIVFLTVTLGFKCTTYWYHKTSLPQANIRLYYSDGKYEDFPIHSIDKIKVTVYDVHHVKVEWEGIDPL